MASASSINGGLYIFGGFGTEGSSVYYNPYLSLGANQQTPNYNYATPPNFVQNPVLMNNPDFINNPNYNPLSGTGYNKVDSYVNNDDRSDENYYPLQDAWFLSYAYEFLCWIDSRLSFVFAIDQKLGCKRKHHNMHVDLVLQLHHLTQRLYRKFYILWASLVWECTR